MASTAQNLAFLTNHPLSKTYYSEGHEPFLIDGQNNGWLVLNGKVDIFGVEIVNGEAQGVREYFTTIDEGSIFCGINFSDVGVGHGFLAVGRTGTQLCRFDRVDVIKKLESSPDDKGPMAELMDGWIKALGYAIVRNIPSRPKPDRLAVPGETIEPGIRGIITTKKDVLWLFPRSGELMFLSTEELFFSSDYSVFPAVPYAWIETFEDRKFEPLETSELIGTDEFEEGFSNFLIAICNTEFVNKSLLAVDEYNRLATKAEYQQAAREEALAEIASVLTPDLKDFIDVRTTGESDALLAAVKLVGTHQGIDIRPHPEVSTREDRETRLDAIAKASRIRIREIALRDDWWRKDAGPFIAFSEDEDEPIAMIPAGPKAYFAISGQTGRKEKVTEKSAANIKHFGKCLYRAFPEGPMNAMDIVRFGMRGLGSEFATVAVMGVGLGLLGLVTPFLTRQIFDTVIPGAEEGQLFQLVLGMIAAGFGSLAFEITRAVAVLRVEGKMDYSVQAALWDRLMGLSLNFFRNYSAGDLANRGYGIDKIREMVSGVGVTAVLGAITSLFYLFLLFKYSVPLASIGLVLVAVAIVLTAILNLLQLNYQRHLYGIIGHITSTVLQFINGVGKIRVAGAEDHAFKVWAKEFSDQRRLSFIVGRIENAVQVFTASFPVVCSLTLFAVLSYVQGEAAANREAPPITTGEFIAFNSAFGVFLSSMLQLSTSSLQIFQTIPIYERFKPIIQAVPEVDEAKSYPGELSGEIEVYHVNFRYDPDGPMILKNVSMKINAGEFVAFVGPSGSGKSTLLRLLMGFEGPESGKIYYDGQDLSSLDLREVRNQIGVVLQTSRLMPTDIYRNIVGNRSLTEEDAMDAADAAGLGDDIRKMPMKMHTVVSEGGGGFSGGQKQRLMIARAIVTKPRMLYLDEATSALDNRSQAIVTESMDRLQATRVVVAHRLSTIRNADRIFVLVDGRVAEEGNYEQLMALDGHFAELARRQIA